MADDLLPLLGLDLYGEGQSSEDENEVDAEQIEVEMMEDTDRKKDKKKSSNDKKKDKKKDSNQNINYDPSLPTAHSYLGTDLQEYSGRTVLEDDCYMSLPLLTLPNVVLIPGQTLPLHLFQPRLVSMMKRVLQTDRTFGLVTWRYDNAPMTGPTLAKIGTTAEIYSVKEESEAGIDTIRIKATGRQRFELIETRRQVDGVTMAKIKILAEADLPDCLQGARLDSHNRFRMNSVRSMKPPECSGDAASNLQTQVKKRKRSAADFTWWPFWIYEQYDAELLINRIKKELSGWYEGTQTKLSNVPSNPTDFSFWVASNLPLDDGWRLHLLEINCAVQRLRCELDLMRKCTILCCKECGQQIANKRDVFSISLDGPMAAYVNPGGYVHETFTLYRASGLNLMGRPSEENSWFPGYAWTITQCRGCASHMGWKFTSVKKKLKPDKFWGLCRSSLIPGLLDQDRDSNWQPIM
ncbi:protein cereblon-like [Saccoglossus kowalevskii]